MSDELIARLVEEIRKLVRNAYNEGFAEGMNEYRKPRTGGKSWEESSIKRRLDRAMLAAAKGETP